MGALGRGQPWGEEQLILTCGPARGVATRRYQTLPVMVLRETPQRANFPPRLILSTWYAMQIRLGSLGTKPADSEPAMPGGGLRTAGSD